MNNYLISGNAAECCGCTACVNICPNKCIELKTNEEGFLYPVKNNNRCLNCGLCEKVCPQSEDYRIVTKDNPSVYAAYDENNRSGSSSGGIFYTIAKYVIENRHGLVFGAAFDKQLKLKHIGIDNVNDLERLRGSKYLQSEMGDTYSQIKKLLINGIFVFFVGTPCQIAGLRCFLGYKDYDNLLLADIVCHGVPSQWLFDEHVNYLEKKHKAKLVSYQFRKPNGWGGCEIADFEHPQKHKELPSYDLSPYLYSFMHSMTYRESCYTCKFASVPRQGDVSLADYWGARYYFPEFDTSEGVSLVLLNTEKGEKIWNNIKGSCMVRESTLKDASVYNGNLIHKTDRPVIRDDIYRRIHKYGYKAVAENDFRIKQYWLHALKIYIANNKWVHKIKSYINKVIR